VGQIYALIVCQTFAELNALVMVAISEQKPHKNIVAPIGTIITKHFLFSETL